MNNAITVNAYNEKISWSVIIAGTLTAIVIGALLNLFGIGIGLISFGQDSETTAFGMGTVIWLILSTIAYSFFGGWVAGRYSAYTKRKTHLLNGFLVWALATSFTIFFISSATGFFMNVGVHAVSGNLEQVTKIAQTNFPGATQATQETMQTTDQAVTSESDTPSETAMMNIEKLTNILAKLALVTFCILLIGAFASLAGAHYGAHRRDRLLVEFPPEGK